MEDYYCYYRYIPVDIRTVSFDIPPQEILTKDSVTVAVDAVVYYRIHDAVASVKAVENANGSTRMLVTVHTNKKGFATARFRTRYLGIIVLQCIA